MTSDQKCAKISISFSVSRIQFPQCHKCAFLRQTNIIFDYFRLDVVCNLRDIFLPVFQTYFFLKIRLRKSLTISGLDTIRNIPCISVQTHSYCYHFIINLFILLNRINRLQKKKNSIEMQNGISIFYGSIKGNSQNIMQFKQKSIYPSLKGICHFITDFLTTFESRQEMVF